MERRTLIAASVIVAILFVVNVWGLFQYGYRGGETIVIIAVPVIAAFVLGFYYIKAEKSPDDKNE